MVGERRGKAYHLSWTRSTTHVHKSSFADFSGLSDFSDTTTGHASLRDRDAKRDNVATCQHIIVYRIKGVLLRGLVATIFSSI